MRNPIKITAAAVGGVLLIGGLGAVTAIGENAPDTDPDVWNEANNITKAESAAMLAGSLFSWESPAANPENYDEAGKLKERPWRPGGAA